MVWTCEKGRWGGSCLGLGKGGESWGASAGRRAKGKVE